jgi:hypothetical protein
MTTTKRERRQQQLNAHYNRLAALYEQTTGKKHPDPKRLSSALLRLERLARIETTAQCNGYYGERSIYRNGVMINQLHFDDESNCIESDSKIEAVIEQVKKLFGGKLPEGFFVNYDARGYALKLKDGRKFGYQDWGGNGILAPDITGNELF